MEIPTTSEAFASALLFLDHQTKIENQPHHHVPAAVPKPTSYCASRGCQRNWKLAFATILFFEGLLFGYMALLLRRFAWLSNKRFRKLLHIVNVFAGGIFLATGLLHILPEAVAFLTPTASGAVPGHLHGHHHVARFPTAFAIVLAMYFVFLFCDRVVKEHFGTFSEKLHDAAGDYELEPEEYDDQAEGEYAWDDDKCDFRSMQSSDAEDPLATRVEESYGFRSPQFLAAAIGALGMGAHSLLESVALGGSARMSVILNTFLAISMHRWATSMALGARFAKERLSVGPYSALIVAFAAVAPTGVLFGLVTQHTSPVFQGVVFAISAATFVYIGAFETPSEEFVAHQRWPLLKFLCMLGGALLIIIVTAILVAVSVH